MFKQTKDSKNIPNSIPITYAGRLDPLASWKWFFFLVMMLKIKINILGLIKIYTAEFIIGISTDTADLLGILIKI